MDSTQANGSEPMSTYEINELIYSGISTAFEIVAIFLTVLFAYFAVAYFVGKRLSRFQVTTITLVYSAFSIFLMVGTYPTIGLPITLLNNYSGVDYGAARTAMLLLMFIS